MKKNFEKEFKATKVVVSSLFGVVTLFGSVVALPSPAAAQEDSRICEEPQPTKDPKFVRFYEREKDDACDGRGLRNSAGDEIDFITPPTLEHVGSGIWSEQKGYVLHDKHDNTFKKDLSKCENYTIHYGLPTVKDENDICHDMDKYKGRDSQTSSPKLKSRPVTDDEMGDSVSHNIDDWLFSR